DLNLELFRAVLEYLARKPFILADAGLILSLASAGGHADPLELSLEGLAAGGGRPLLAPQSFLFLIEPRRVVPLPGNPLPSVQLQDPTGHVVQEVTIMRDGH